MVMQVPLLDYFLTLATKLQDVHVELWFSPNLVGKKLQLT